MSSEDDRDSKTEEASEKKIFDTLQKGNIPQSRDVITCFNLLGILLASYFFISSSSEQFGRSIEYIIHYSGQIRISSNTDAQSLLVRLAVESFTSIFVILLLITSLGIIGSISQSTPSIVGDRIKPKLSRLSVSSGFKRLFGFGSLIEFCKTFLKILFMIFIVFLFLFSFFPKLSAFLYFDIRSLLSEIKSQLNLILSFSFFSFIVVAAIDVFLVRSRWKRDLRMTPKEVKDEVKESEGSPMMKSLRRSISLKRSRNRMMRSIPDSTVILTNPTHFSVALRYDRGKDSAPVLLAKGQDLIALRIREIARASDIPIVESKMLARALFKSVEVNQVIPIEFYRAVAEIIIVLQNTARLKSTL